MLCMCLGMVSFTLLFILTMTYYLHCTSFLSVQPPTKSVSLLRPSLGIISPSADRRVFLHHGLLHAKRNPELQPSSYLGSWTCFFLFLCGISNPRHQSVNQEVCSDLALLAAPSTPGEWLTKQPSQKLQGWAPQQGGRNSFYEKCKARPHKRNPPQEDGEMSACIKTKREDEHCDHLAKDPP